MFIEKRLVRLVIVPEGQKMSSFFRNGNIFILLFNLFIRPIFFSNFELPMQNKDLKASILIQENKTAFLSGKATPNDIVEGELSYKSVVELSFIVESDLVFKGQNCHLLTFDLHELSFYWLGTHLHSVSLGEQFESVVGKNVMGDGLICTYQQQVRETETGTGDWSVVFDLLRRFVLVIVHIDANISFSSNAKYEIFLQKVTITQQDSRDKRDNPSFDDRMSKLVKYVQPLQFCPQKHITHKIGL